MYAYVCMYVIHMHTYIQLVLFLWKTLTNAFLFTARLMNTVRSILISWFWAKVIKGNLKNFGC